MKVDARDLEASFTAWQATISKPQIPATWTLRSLWTRYRDDLIWITIYILINAFAFWLRYREYAVDPCVACGPAIAKGSAEVVMLNCVLTLLSVCHRVIDRLRLWVTTSSTITQRPLEMHREFHVLTGSVVLVMSLVHSITWGLILHWSRTCDDHDWIQSSLSAHKTKRLREEPAFARLLLTLPMWTGLAMLLGVVLLLPFCIGRVRRACFHAFENVHRLMLLLFIVLLSFHGAAQWTSRLQAPLWLMPAIAIYIAERHRRLSQATCATILCFGTTESPPVISKNPTNTTIRLFLTKTKRFHRCFEPGMFVYLQVPAISTLEWHAFSVCSSQDDALVELRIRIVGDWTHQLRSYLHAVGRATSGFSPDHSFVPVSIPARIDGPFGTPTIHYHRYDSIAMVALGVGVSPFLSVLRHQLHTGRQQLRLQMHGSPTTPSPLASHLPLIKFVWVVRDVALVEWLTETLCEFDDVVTSMGRDVLDLQVFVTARSTDPPLFPGRAHVRVHYTRRPDWPRLLDEWTAASATRAPRAVFVSGSRAATRAIKHAAATLPMPQRVSVDVYAERFH